MWIAQVGDSSKAANESAVSPVMNFTMVSPYGNASDYPFRYGVTADLGQTVYSNATVYGLQVNPNPREVVTLVCHDIQLLSFSCFPLPACKILCTRTHQSTSVTTSTMVCVYRASMHGMLCLICRIKFLFKAYTTRLCFVKPLLSNLA